MSKNTHVLSQLAQALANDGVAHKVVGMAVRPYTQEAPLWKTVKTVSQAIKRAITNAPANMARNYHSGYANSKPAYKCLLSSLGVDPKIIDTYGDLNIYLEEGDPKAMGWFYRPNTIRILYASAMADETTTDFRSCLRGFDQTIEHECRHWLDWVSKTHPNGFDRSTHDDSVSEYYNREHEIDARLTSLFCLIDTLFRGSSIMALQNKVDELSKEHHNLLKGDFQVFYSWLGRKDAKYASWCFDVHRYTPEMYTEVKGKCREFFKFLIEEYGMALRVTKSSDVTPAQKRAWKALLESTKDKTQHKAQIAKIASK